MNTKQNAGFSARRALAVTVTNLFVVAAFFLCAQTALRAQGVNATLTGTATDQSGAILPGVTVRITNPETGFQREVQTSDNGNFTFPALSPATYTVSASKDGFAPAEFNNLTLNVNDQRSLRIELKVGNVSGSVEVNANEASLIDDSAAQSTTIDRTFVNRLPINARSFQSLIFLSPGVVPVATTIGSTGQFSVNGQRPNANNVTVDGVSANVSANNPAPVASGVLATQSLTGSLPGFSAVGTTNTLVPVDALEEFKIQTSTYSAEFGRQPGGQVQIVTRSGKSDFHGSIFDYVRNEAFDANDFFRNSNPNPLLRGRLPRRQNQFGGTFSGPVFLPRFGEGGPLFYNGKKRTFFFFAYEGTRLRLPASTLFFVPSVRIRQLAAPAFRPFLNAYPIPTEPELTDAAGAPLGYAPFNAAFSNPSSQDTYGIRIDHNLTNQMTLFGRYNEAPSSSLTRSLSVLSGGRNKLRTLTLGTTYAGKSFSNELRFNYTVNRGRFNYSLDDYGGAVPFDISAATLGGYNGSGVTLGEFSLTYTPNIPTLRLGDNQDSFNRQINIVDNFSLVKGAHIFKFGFDYRRLMPTFGPVAYARTSSVNTAALLIDGTATIQSITQNQGVEPRVSNYSFYGQDDWKVNKRLKLNLGLRYELNPAPYDANGIQPITVRGIVGEDVSGAFIAPAGTPFYETFKTAFAPRIGAVYQLRDKSGRETVLRGGFGVFYDLGSGQSLSGFNQFPFRSSRSVFLQPFPLTPAQSEPRPFSTPTLPLTTFVSSSDPDLKLPYTLQYNFGVEQSLGKDQAISISYVGAKGRQLLANRTLNPFRAGGLGFANTNFQQIFYTTNASSSDYDSMQVQFQSRLTRGFQALVNYTWSHAIDDGSDEFADQAVRGNASFDVRHNFSTALTYEIPTFTENRFARAILGGWSVGSTIYIQSGQPIDIIVANQTFADGRLVTIRPDYVAGQPFWIEQAGVPGGRRINPAAFVLPPRVGASNSPFARQGTFGRNVVVGPALFQTNLGLSREFKLTERLRFEVRGETFNLLNKPQFSRFGTNLFTPATFGIATSTLNTSLGGVNSLYQLGGPRSMQFSGRLFF